MTVALRRIDPERADAYVSTVARNLLRTAFRRRVIDGRRRLSVELGTIADHRDGADACFEYEELVHAVHCVIAAKLPPPLAETVRAVLRGFTASEIAARQGVSPVTVRTRLMRARAVLRKELRGYLDTSEVELPPSRPQQRHLVEISRRASG